MKQECSVVELVDTLVRAAVDHHASDIHLESCSDHLRVRWRIDGILYDKEKIDISLMSQVLSRIKVMAHIDIAEKRIPQDGKFKVLMYDRELDLRVSTFPSMYGEKIVIRILDRACHIIALEQLGLSEVMREMFIGLLSRSTGFFLVSGPTGSGKTTTLYAALSFLNSPTKNIITLEDPVEYSIDGVTQAQIHPDAGFTFEKGIRSLLRQDPDIVMIGEIRDKQTAQVAIEAAMTGHLVFSTIHTNDAPTVIVRLVDMGIEPFLINAALTGVLAQRLARVICGSCKTIVEPTDHELCMFEQLGCAPCTLYKGIGCSACLGLGYKGRIGIFELLVVTPALRSLIMQRAPLDLIVRQAMDDGMHTLVADGMLKVREGIITLDELVRIAL